MDRPLVALLLAGGTGTRLYPASRADRPKQLQAFGGDRSLLRRTADRVRFADERFVVTSERYKERVGSEVPSAGVLVEAESKDTGPALVYAAHRVREQVGDCVVCCLPSDHRVAGDFEGVLRRAAAVAADTGGLVALGVEPDRPATGYGYIQPGEARDGYAPIAEFREKPDAETAARFVDAGYYWNAGVFAWTPSALLEAARDSPLAPLVDALDDDPARGFAEVPAISVDYAVMERAENAYVVPAAVEWDDLGSWDALARVLDADGDGNAVVGEALPIDAAGNVVASDGKHVSLVGVSDLVVAAYDDRVLVVPTDEAQRVREVVDALREDGRF